MIKNDFIMFVCWTQVKTIKKRKNFNYNKFVFVSRSHENALLTAAGCNQSLIQSHTQRKS